MPDTVQTSHIKQAIRKSQCFPRSLPTLLSSSKIPYYPSSYQEDLVLGTRRRATPSLHSASVFRSSHGWTCLEQWSPLSTRLHGIVCSCLQRPKVTLFVLCETLFPLWGGGCLPCLLLLCALESRELAELLLFLWLWSNFFVFVCLLSELVLVPCRAYSRNMNGVTCYIISGAHLFTFAAVCLPSKSFWGRWCLDC